MLQPSWVFEDQPDGLVTLLGITRVLKGLLEPRRVHADFMIAHNSTLILEWAMATATLISPVNLTTTTNGFFDPSHISTAAIVYSPNTIPTPWPILTLSFGISILTSAWASGLAIHRYLREQRGRPISSASAFATGLTGAAIIYSFIRICATFILAIRAGLSGSETKSPDLSAVYGMFFSTSQYMVLDVIESPTSTSQVKANWMFKKIVGLIILVLLVTEFLLAIRILKKSPPYYSKWALIGGECPLPVRDCSQLAFVGCGQDALTGVDRVPYMDINTLHNANFLRLLQFIVAVIAMMILGLLGVAFLSNLVTTACQLREHFSVYKPRFPSWSSRSRQQPKFRMTRVRQDSDEFERPKFRITVEVTPSSKLSTSGGHLYLKMIPTILILVFAVVSVPLTYRQQSNPRSLHIIDSFGSATPIPNSHHGTSYTGGNSTIWTDCFQIQAPTDKYGFLQYWWSDHQNRIAEVLALV